MNQKGQGLLETIIAISVVVVGIMGAIVLVNVTLRSTTSTMNRQIALNLSWEAIEVAVNIRDSNFLAEDPFNAGLDGGVDQTAILTFIETSNVWVPDFTPNNLSDEATRFFHKI